MISAADLASKTHWVLSLSFLVSALFGAIVHHTHFCTMGAISDVVLMGNWKRMRQWLLAAGVAMVGFAALAAAELIRPGDTIYAGSRWMWLSTVVGGLLFGFGMVLSSGCGSKTLVRIGGGNLKSLVVFLAMALASYATLRGITAVARAETVDRVFVQFTGPATFGHWSAAQWGLPEGWAVGAWGASVGAVLIAFALLGRDFMQRQNLFAGVGVGLTVVAMWAVSGALGFVPEHPETLEPTYLATNSGRMEALTFTGPMAYAIDWLMFFSDRNKVLTIAVVSVAGVVVGAAFDALVTKRFRWEGFRTTEDLANHLVGGVLMGVGGVTALGCTIGQGLSGVSTLSFSSLTAIAGIVAGAVAALSLQRWRLEREA